MFNFVAFVVFCLLIVDKLSGQKSFDLFQLNCLTPIAAYVVELSGSSSYTSVSYFLFFNSFFQSSDHSSPLALGRYLDKPNSLYLSFLFNVRLGTSMLISAKFMW